MTGLELKTLDRKQLAARLHKTRRLALYRSVHEALDSTLSEEELDIHFTHMPARYWPRATAESVCRHLLLIRQFCARLTSAQEDATTPAIAWRQVPERNVTEVTLCTWDRVGLLATVAGAFAAVDLNILRADAFTRVDNLVLDVFEVCDANGNYLQDEARLQTMMALLTPALRPGAKSPATSFSAPPRATSAQPPAVYFDVEPKAEHTVVVIEADDRIGLLYRVFSVLADCEVNVSQAIITTENKRVGDVLYVTDANGQQITDRHHLEHIREGLLSVL